MSKRMLAAALALAVCLAMLLAGCSGSGAASDKTDPTAGADALWPALAGVWVNENENGADGSFLIFGSDAGRYTVSQGALESEGGGTGALLSLERVEDGVYDLSFSYSAADGGEGSGAESMRVDASRAAEKAITVTLAGGKTADYAMLGATLEEARRSAAGPEELSSPQELWKRLAGVWVCTEEGELKYYFLDFYIENGECTLYYGLLASGFGRVGSLERLEEGADGRWTMSVAFPAIPANEMDDAVDAYTATMTVDTSAAAEKSIEVSFGADGPQARFDLLGATLEEAAANAGIYG